MAARRDKRDSGARRNAGLSKSRFVTGLRCPKLMWWTVHESKAPEMVPSPANRAIMDQGARVGEVARTYVPGGVLVDAPYFEHERKIAQTKAALDAGAKAVYEASFSEDGVFVAVDILERERRRGGFRLVEVKSTTKVKDEHIPDVAIQTHVLERAGLKVLRSELMHLNRECRYPDLSNLFVREDVTAAVEPELPAIPGQIRALRAALAGPLPDTPTGPQCHDPEPCPFMARCWPPMPEHHVSTLYRIRRDRVDELVGDGYATISDLPDDFPAKGPAARQIRSVRRGKLIVDPGLRAALYDLAPPIAYLDFETVNLAIPVWPGSGPYTKVPVQFSCHIQGKRGLLHREWLADGPDDPREPIARALLDACAGARTVLTYSSYERQCIDGLIEALPHLAADLDGLKGRLRDLLPIVQDNIYHPEFGGSFSIKSVLPALVPSLGYDDLAIQDGSTASAALETLLFRDDTLATSARRALRRDLLAYCERDTRAMVRLHERLKLVSGGG